ncbi:MAG: hypothetical protein ACKV19_19795 [Verrucomicrobiales bacterium]
MRRIQTGDQEQLAYEEPLGLGSLYYAALALCGFGLPIFLLARSGSRGILGIGNSGGDFWLEKVIALALAGAWLLFTLRAVSRAFRRLAFVIDRREQTIRTRSWWPFPPGHAKPLASFNLVAVGEISIPGPLASSIPTRQTTVALVDLKIGKPLRFAIGDDSPMRTLAEDVARFAGFDLIDTTAEEPVVIPVAEVGRVFSPVAAGSQEPWELRALPPHSTLAVSPASGGLRIEFPKGNAGCFGTLVCSLLGVLSVIVYTAFHAESLNQWLIYPIFGGVAMIVLMIAGAGSMPVRIVLEATVEGVRIIRYGPFGKKLISLRRDAIRGFLTEGIAFTIRWENGEWSTLELSPGERAWVADALSAALRAPVTFPG